MRGDNDKRIVVCFCGTIEGAVIGEEYEIQVATDGTVLELEGDG